MYVAIEGVIGVGKTTLAASFNLHSMPRSFWRSLKEIRSSLIFTATVNVTLFKRKFSFY